MEPAEPDGPTRDARRRLPRPDRSGAARLTTACAPSWTLTVANLRSFVRDRAALFWTLAFPVIFVILFGTIFSGGGTPTTRSAGSTRTARRPSAALRDAASRGRLLELIDGTDLETASSRCLTGDVDAIIVVPEGLGDAIDGGGDGRLADPGRS